MLEVEFTVEDLALRCDEIAAEATLRPVKLIQAGRPVAVMLSEEHYLWMIEAARNAEQNPSAP